MDKKLEISYKEIAIDFLQLSATGKANKAFAKYVGPNFRHYNPYFKREADSLLNAMMENAEKIRIKFLKYNVLYRMEKWLQFTLRLNKIRMIET